MRDDGEEIVMMKKIGSVHACIENGYDEGFCKMACKDIDADTIDHCES